MPDNYEMLIRACEKVLEARVAHRDALAEVNWRIRGGIEAGCLPGDMRDLVEMAMAAARIRRAPEAVGSREG